MPVRRVRMAGKFELRVQPRRDNQLMLEVYQYPNGRDSEQDAPEQVVRIWGLPFQAGSDAMLSLVQEAGHRISAFSPTDGSGLPLAEEEGVRLCLLAMALKPLRKLERIREIQHGVEAMSREEATYWFSKAVGADSYNDRRRIMKAMRILLSPE
jgi:hypothetical protein